MPVGKILMKTYARRSSNSRASWNLNGFVPCTPTMHTLPRITNADGRLCMMEQKGPPDHPTYAESGAVHQCGLIMAAMVSPPRIGLYLKFMAGLARDYPKRWALQYQMDDRWRFEQIPQLLRKQQAIFQANIDKYVARNCFPSLSDEESYFDPRCPFDYLLWMSVNAQGPYKWWQDNFIRQADKIVHGIKKLADCLDGDATLPSTDNTMPSRRLSIQHRLRNR